MKTNFKEIKSMVENAMVFETKSFKYDNMKALEITKKLHEVTPDDRKEIIEDFVKNLGNSYKEKQMVIRMLKEDGCEAEQNVGQCLQDLFDQAVKAQVILEMNYLTISPIEFAHHMSFIVMMDLFLRFVADKQFD